MKNESDLWIIAKKKGFEKIILTGKSVEQQAEIFASAKVILAPHGAGLTNLIFCQADVKIIEIMSPNYTGHCYYRLSEHLNLNHTVVYGERISWRDIFKNGVLADYKIDTRKIEKLI